MARSITKHILLFIILVLVQVLICNRIVLFSQASPIIFIYFLISMPLSTNRNLVLTIGFLTGLLIDIFSDTPGMNALACSLMCVLRRPVSSLYISHDSELPDGVAPTLRSLGVAVYLKYLGTLTLIYTTAIFFIEYFSIISVIDILKRIIFSSLLSFVLMIGIDSLLLGRKKT